MQEGRGEKAHLMAPVFSTKHSSFSLHCQHLDFSLKTNLPSLRTYLAEDGHSATCMNTGPKSSQSEDSTPSATTLIQRLAHLTNQTMKTQCFVICVCVLPYFYIFGLVWCLFYLIVLEHWKTFLWNY